MTLCPELVHRGRQTVAGWWVQRDHLGPTAARQRVLCLWTPHSRVFEHASGFVILSAEARSVRGPFAATPLVDCHGLLSACPLTEDEARSLAAPPRTVLLVASGMAEVWRPTSEINLGQWLDIGDLAVAHCTHLGAKPAPIPKGPPVISAPAAKAFGVSVDVDGVTRVRKALEQGSAGSPGRSRLLGSLVRPLRGLRSWFQSAAHFFGSRRSNGGQPSPTAPPPAPSLFQQIADRLDRWAANLALRAGLGALIGQKHAKYLQDLLDELNRGDPEAALRRAIPLASGGGGSSRPTMGLLNHQNELSPRLHRTTGGGGTIAAGDLFGSLRKAYELAAKRLEANGRFRQAAYVWTDLIGNPERGVALLERAKDYAFAAQLAQVHNLDAGWVIRLVWLSGDLEQTLRLARLTGEFESAIRALQGPHPKLATTLRVSWASTLASAGQFGAAVDVIWPIEGARKTAVAWLDRAVAQGGPSGARSLVRQLELQPDRWTESRAKALSMLRDTGVATRSIRTALADALIRAPSSPAVRVLCRAALRSTAREPASPNQHQRVQKLKAACLDPALALDCPQISKPGKAPYGAHVWDRADVGGAPVHDAALLPNGNLLIAMGEAGLYERTADGREVAWYNVPAHALVVGHLGQRVLALARRDDAWSIHKVDLVYRTHEHWVLTRLQAFARTYDGQRWFVAFDRSLGVQEAADLAAIDTLSDDWIALWTHAHIGRSIEAVAVTERRLYATVRLLEDSQPSEVWVHKLSGPRLTRRIAVDAATAFDDTRWAGVPRLIGDATAIYGGDAGQTHSISLPGPAGSALCFGDGLALCYSADDATVIQVHDLHNGARVGRFEFQGAAASGVRAGHGSFVFWDDRGRVVAWHRQTNAVWADLRMR